MKQLLYVGKFNPWNDKHEDELFEALETFDQVTIAVTMLNDTPIKGQPIKVLSKHMKNKIKIVYFRRLSNLLHVKNDIKYIMFER